MAARIAEIVVLRPGSELQVEVAANNLARIVMVHDDGVAASTTPSATATVRPGSYDILNVRIRQNLDTVLQDIETAFARETVKFGRRNVWVTAMPVLRAAKPLSDGCRFPVPRM